MSSVSLSTKFSLLALLMVALLATMTNEVQAKSACKHHPHSHGHSSHHGHHKGGHHKGGHHAHHNHHGHNKPTHTSKGGSSADPKPTSPPASSGSDSSDNGNNSDSSSTSTSTATNSGSGSDPGSGSSTPSGGNGKYGPTPPKGKAGVAGGNSLKWTADYLGWYTDWTPNPNNPNAKNIESVPMLWGLGRVGHDDDQERFEAFKKLTPGSSPYVIGFNEADFQGSGSSGLISPKDAAAGWDQYIAPHGEAGSLLISPSCAMQKDENWLQPFLDNVKRQPDMINVHIFQKTIEGVKGVLDHYAKYNKPLWITEFACINYQVQPTEYCSQQETSNFLSEAIKLFESDDRVAAYAVSDAFNGPVSALTPNHSGQSLSTTGQSFLSDVKAVASKARRSLFRRVRRSAADQQ